MITKIQISNIATYKNTIIEPKTINFIYGGNGAGKTTLSRVIARETEGESAIKWSTADRPRVIVYNRDFVDRNFSVDKSLPGIFTLGSESVEIRNEIDDLKIKQIKEKEQREGSNTTLENLKKELYNLTEESKEKCWEVQRTYGTLFADALIGYRSSRDKFFEKCIQQFQSKTEDIEPVHELEQIQNIYQAAFTKEAEMFKEYPELNINGIEKLDNQPLLSKVITGQTDTPVGTFIRFLNAGDWVKQGIAFAEKTNGKCPFCQRTMPNDIAEQIVNFFDEEYKRDCADLEEYQIQYDSWIKNIRCNIKEIIEKQYRFINYDNFTRLIDIFENIADYNLRIIQSKLENPSKFIEIKPLKETIEKLNLEIISFNNAIRRNNDTVEHQNDSRKKCQELIWAFFLNKLNDTLLRYQKKAKGIHNGIKQIEDKIRNNDRQIISLGEMISDRESKLTSVKPTVTAINKILNSFGFMGFSLAENKEEPGTYLIIRSDGSDASRTLSEGEHNFISFLYFYHLCFGSQTNTGIMDDKIVVIDDPISSLDSNVVFVISTLVKSVIKNCLEKREGIKQVFVLTHNIYFHKEVTFLGSRNHYKPREVAYFIIRKRDETSIVIPYDENPIKTSYEILWDEIKKPTNSSAKSVFNTMRRILEHYFQVIGGINYEKCINEFDGEDKTVCKALIAFINDGSHTIFDDLIVSFDETSLENYLRVFRLIFEKLNQIDHYNMMMGISDDQEINPQSLNERTK